MFLIRWAPISLHLSLSSDFSLQETCERLCSSKSHGLAFCGSKATTQFLDDGCWSPVPSNLPLVRPWLRQAGRWKQHKKRDDPAKILSEKVPRVIGCRVCGPGIHNEIIRFSEKKKESHPFIQIRSSSPPKSTAFGWTPLLKLGLILFGHDVSN